MMRLLLTILLLTACHAWGATYYVATNGNNSAAGTNEATAWLTLAKAASVVSAGDTVKLNGGVWNENISTATAGTSGNKIVWDGQGISRVYRVDADHAHNTYQNLILGHSNSFYFAFEIGLGADYTVISNCYVSNYAAFYCGGVRFNIGSQKPFDTNAAKYCLVINNTFNYMGGETATFSVAGTSNTIQGNLATNFHRGNSIYLFGQYNTIRGNTFSNFFGYPDYTNATGHPDFIQTFASNGDGSYGHLLESNVWIGDYTPAMRELRDSLLPTNDIAVYSIAGGQLNFGVGLVEIPSTYTNNPLEFFINNNQMYEWIKGSNEVSIQIGSVIYTNSTVFISAGASNVAILTGVAVETNVTCILGNGGSWETVEDVTGNWTFRNNTFAFSQGVMSMGLPNCKFYNNVFYEVGTASSHPIGMSYTHYRNKANGAIIHNNTFINCGSSTNTGWYGSATPVTNVTAEYNYVSHGTNFGPVRSSLWFETNGINGGDPGVVSASNLNFRLLSDSILIGQGTNLDSSFTTDAAGVVRGTLWDMGAYEYASDGLILHYTFADNFTNNGFILDQTGGGHDAILMDATNLPRVAAGPTNIGGNAWSGYVNGTMTNDPPQVYNKAQYAAITNLGELEFITNGTIAVWVQWATNAERADTILDCSYPPTFSGAGSNDAINSWWWNYGGPVSLSGSPTGPVFRVFNSDSLTSNTNGVLARWTQPRDGATWYHIAVTWSADSNSFTAYQDGAQSSTNEFPNPYLRVNSAAWISMGAMQHLGTPEWGDDDYPNAGFFKSKMADVRIYNRVLSASEIAAIVGTAPATAAPSIDTQPSSKSTLTNVAATLSVTASGTAPLAYQWRNTTNITGATSASYAFTSASAGTFAGFDVVITNLYGAATSSPTVTVTVTNDIGVAPSISAQPASVSMVTNDSRTLSVTASGTAPLSYQWRLSSNSIPSATTNTYSFTTNLDGSYSLDVIITNFYGSVTSSLATVTVTNLIETFPPIQSTNHSKGRFISRQ